MDRKVILVLNMHLSVESLVVRHLIFEVLHFIFLDLFEYCLAIYHSVILIWQSVFSSFCIIVRK